ncbi:shikimate kinase [Actinomyces sp. B33]|uniref:shikimate kinase n=1 Tax=Actinomyces sp. B33 TaxID=2942131 RepID=UPI00233F7EA9|nr:shikimate kinase [Actinomyces sp. B33]MDC4233347.1 shikimate kinase [Actinomyces sp. B33]
MGSEAPLIVLVGASGAGKTVVGALVAERLGVGFVEADALVAERMGAPVAELIIHGAEGFDEARRGAALEALSRSGAVVSIGASQVLDPVVVESLGRARSAGALVVELSVSIADVARRMGLNAPRSAALGAPRAVLAGMIAEVHGAATAVADHSVGTDGVTPERVADEVIAACRLAGDSHPPEAR